MKWIKVIAKYIITFIILVGFIGLFGGTVPNSIIRVFEVKEVIIFKEKAFEDPSVNKLNNIYKYIINPLRDSLGEIYETSTGRCNDRGSHHDYNDTMTVAADIDQDVLKGAASNREIYVYIRDNWDYDQLSVGYSFRRPTYIHVSIKLYGKNRKEILIKRGKNNYRKVN